MAKNILLLVFFILTYIALLQPIQAQNPQTLIDAEPLGVKDFWRITDIQKGQKIAVKVKIGVQKESPRSLDGFWIRVNLTKPSGETIEKWFDYTDEIISRGSEKSYTLKTGVLADQVGTWKVYVELWDKDKKSRINYDSATFKVVENLPPPGEVGYLVVGGLVVAGALIALRR